MLELHNDSHMDHGLNTAQVAYALARFADRTGFFIETIELPPELGTVPCGVYGPVMGEDPPTDTFLGFRGKRTHSSRLTALPTRPTSKMTIIAGEHDGKPCVLYTAFGGPLTPMEPGDPKLLAEGKPHEVANAVEFWQKHALAYDRDNDRVPTGTQRALADRESEG